MKKLLAVIGIISLFGAYAYAESGFGLDSDGKGKRGKYNSCEQQDNFAALTEEEATLKVEEFISNNFKGYSLSGSPEVKTGKRGSAYIFPATDAAGNEFYFAAHPKGGVKGPISKAQFEAMAEKKEQKKQERENRKNNDTQ